ncbi:MAG: carboxypeptidase-like regulatory domain-containing protein [Xanthobacteraceae bacterium]
MTLDRVWLHVALTLTIIIVLPSLALAGGTGFGDDDSDDDNGPSYFGFVREIDGPGIADAKVTAALKDRGALVTRTDIMGVYKIPGFGKDVDPKDITISCAKDGYKETSVDRRPNSDPKDPVEIECYLHKQ